MTTGKNSLYIKQTLSLVSIILLLGSCTPVPFRVSHHETNLSQYNKNGFFITTGDYANEYEPISILTSSCNSVYTQKQTLKKPTNSKTKTDDIYFSPNDTSGYDWTSTTTQDLLNEMVAKAKASGADALIRLKISAIYSYSGGRVMNIAGYNATATAIKRVK